MLMGVTLPEKLSYSLHNPNSNEYSNRITFPPQGTMALES